MNDEQKQIYLVTYQTVLQAVAPRVATFGEAVQQASDAAKSAADLYPGAKTEPATTSKSTPNKA